MDLEGMDVFYDVPAKHDEMDLCDCDRIGGLYLRLTEALMLGHHTTAQTLMTEVKGLLPPLSSFLGRRPTDRQFRLLEIMRDVHELEIELSHYCGGPGAFDRALAQLRPYYEEPWVSCLPRSLRRCSILRKYLAGLLDNERVDQFHMELKSLSATDLDDPDIKAAIAMEKFWTAKRVLPPPRKKTRHCCS